MAGSFTSHTSLVRLGLVCHPSSTKRCSKGRKSHAPACPGGHARPGRSCCSRSPWLRGGGAAVPSACPERVKENIHAVHRTTVLHCDRVCLHGRPEFHAATPARADLGWRRQ